MPDSLCDYRIPVNINLVHTSSHDSVQKELYMSAHCHTSTPSSHFPLSVSSSSLLSYPYPPNSSSVIKMPAKIFPIWVLSTDSQFCRTLAMSSLKKATGLCVKLDLFS